VGVFAYGCRSSGYLQGDGEMMAYNRLVENRIY